MILRGSKCLSCLSKNLRHYRMLSANWAVIAMSGMPNKTQVGDMGIDGRIFPVVAAPTKTSARKGETPAFEEFLDHWYPIQVKQKDKVGRPDIAAFEAVMTAARWPGWHPLSEAANIYQTNRSRHRRVVRPRNATSGRGFLAGGGRFDHA